MIEGSPRRDWFWLWVLGSLAVHGAILLAAPGELPRAAPGRQLLQVSLAPPEVTRRDQEAGPRRAAALERAQPSPARRASVSAAPRSDRPPESTAQRGETAQPTQHMAPTGGTREPQPTDAAEMPQPVSDGLWGEVFASPPSAGGAVSTVDGMCGSGAEGDAAEGAHTQGEQGAGEAGDAGGGDGRGQLAAPVGQSLPRPAYPEEARRRGEEGEVGLRVLVGADGRVARVVVMTSSGHERLDEAAREGARRWRFQPARRGGEPIRAWVELPVRFRLEDPN